MRRRVVVAGLSALAAVPLPLVAQRKETIRRVGILMGSSAANGDLDGRLTVFRASMREKGWNEGRNIQFDLRFAQGDPALMRRMAAELMAASPDIVLAHSPQVLTEVRKVAGATPIVFVQVPFPVESGFIASLARPGGSITGSTIFEAPIAGKWLELLSEIDPRIRRVLVLYNSQNVVLKAFIDVVVAAAPSRVIEIEIADAWQLDEAAQRVAELARKGAAGVLVLPDLHTVTHSKRILDLMSAHRLPAVYPFRSWTTGGGLISYSPEIPDMFRKAAYYVDRILRGTPPHELPVEAPNRFTLIINNKTASSLGIEVPPMLLARADEVIE